MMQQCQGGFAPGVVMDGNGFCWTGAVRGFLLPPARIIERHSSQHWILARSALQLRQLQRAGQAIILQRCWHSTSTALSTASNRDGGGKRAAPSPDRRPPRQRRTYWDRYRRPAAHLL